MKYELELTHQYLKDLKLARKRYKGFRECHIAPDWLLIYSRETTIKIVTLVRTGTHSDLF